MEPLSDNAKKVFWVIGAMNELVTMRVLSAISFKVEAKGVAAFDQLSKELIVSDAEIIAIVGMLLAKAGCFEVERVQDLSMLLILYREAPQTVEELSIIIKEGERED